MLVLAQPFYLLGIPVGIVLRPVYMLLGRLVLPLLLVVAALSAVWAFLAGLIYLFCRVSQTLPVLRPVSFVLALPFLLAALIVVTLAPVPSPADAEAKMVKWRFVEKFPYSAEVIRG